MNRKIFWKWGKRDSSAMENAYKKAEESGNTDILEVMEDEALKEAQKHCVILPGAKLYVEREPEKMAVTPETFHLLKEDEVEGVICFLGRVALMKRSEVSSEELEITASPAIMKCPSCAAFQLMEELEKVDSSKKMLYKINMLEKNDLFGAYMSFLKVLYPNVEIRLVLQ